MSQPGTEKTRVLIIDDSKLMRLAAQKMLREEFDVVTAEDAEQGWAQLRADNAIRVVFTDLSMPGLDGYGLLARIRTSEDPGVHDLPVIVVTGAENDEAARAKALEQGATDFITKPFNSTDLLARARAHAHYQRLSKTLQARSTLDPLTELSNKAGFFERLQQALSFAARHRQPLSVVRIEIDCFNELFLSHGKEAANRLIVHVARAIAPRVRKEDSAGRVGLASFALALPSTAQTGALELAERIRAAVEAEPAAIGEEDLTITVSAAVVSPQADPDLSAAGVLESCQPLLSAAQAEGNRVCGEPTATTGTRAVSIDALLARLQDGHTESVRSALPRALEQLLPLLALLDEEQRGRLKSALQRSASVPQPG